MLKRLHLLRALPLVLALTLSWPTAQAQPQPSISAGYRQTCALLTGGTVRCWGQNSSNISLGDGTFITQRNNPVQVLRSGSTQGINVLGALSNWPPADIIPVRFSQTPRYGAGEETSKGSWGMARRGISLCRFRFLRWIRFATLLQALPSRVPSEKTDPYGAGGVIIMVS